MNDAQRLLASAALDGAVTSEERARAEADPEVVAEIERLRTVRAALQVAAEPDTDRRESSIATALAAFDTDSSVTAPPPASLEARRRTRWIAPLAAAAAVAVIAVGAVVALQDGDSDDDLASTSATVVSPAAAADTAAGGEGESAPDMLVPEGAEDGDLSAEAPAAATDAAEATAAESELSTRPAIETLRTPDELADFAGRSPGVEEATDASEATCAVGTLLGTAYYVVGGTEVLVEVFEVADPHEAVAVELDSCDVVARAPLP